MLPVDFKKGLCRRVEVSNLGVKGHIYASGVVEGGGGCHVTCQYLEMPCRMSLTLIFLYVTYQV